ncbi:hypothetical protein [Adhaeribacter radiodurans]|uniref:DUF4386 family protein n=1 Tax=Adhaeribacter radiodurans TaxID=2745197 RepID=A0A7L7L6J7_9BACT|nr:hypothetical protein [Adhaeribacter radiodurans]QMU28135.1 hypothetical protein HUW48_08795 [Adhaeribacter radiodurans]
MIIQTLSTELKSPQQQLEPSLSLLAFPGRWIGGVSLVLGPLLILTGALLRIQFHFFAPQQLAAFAAHPDLITAAYSCYAMGSVVLCLGIILLANLIGRWNRMWEIWGGTLAILGLFTRTFHAGIDHMAFRLVLVQSQEMAWQAVSDSYRAFHIFRHLNGTIMVGWVVLAIGVYRSGTLTLVRALALGLMVMVPFGTLKGTEIRAIGLLGLCVALVPLGITILRQGPPLSRKALFWIISINLLGLIFTILSLFFPALKN